MRMLSPMRLKGAPGSRQEEEEPRRPKAVAAIEDFQETADEVTGKIEQADKLLQAASSGKLLDLGNVTGEIDPLLDLFARLDRTGRFEEELRLMRSLTSPGRRRPTTSASANTSSTETAPK